MMGLAVGLLLFLGVFLGGSRGCNKLMSQRKPGDLEPILSMRVFPDDDTFVPGTNFTVTCIANSSDATSIFATPKQLRPYSIVFIVNSTIIRGVCPEGATETKVCSKNIAIRNTAKTRFKCHAYNLWSCVWQFLYITIRDPSPPDLPVVPPPKLNVTEGKTFNLSCQSASVPRPVITWYKNGQLLTNHPGLVVTWYRGTSTLVIPTASYRRDQGQYYCRATNSYGNLESNRTYVQVFAAPVFLQEPDNQTTSLASNVTFRCIVAGNPLPVIGWLVNGSDVNFLRLIHWTVVHAGNTSMLHLTNISRQHHATYRCYAKNQVDNLTSKPAYLVISGPVIDQELKTMPSTDSPHTSPIPRRDVSDPPSSSLQPDDKTWLVAGTFGGILVVVCILGTVVICVNRRRRKRITTYQVNKVADDKELNILFGVERRESLQFHDKTTPDEDDDATYLKMMGIDRNWEIPRDRLTLTNQKLGDGCFGKVFTGSYMRTNGKEMRVAVKLLNDNASDDDRRDLVAEIEILKHVGRHPNIVSLVGACTFGEPLCLVIEYVEGGNLRDLLIKSRLHSKRSRTKESGYENVRSLLNECDLLNIAVDVASGMAHLESKQCIHRDLAARNVLIGMRLVAKVADFGLARDVSTTGQYIVSGNKVPWKWMAPEALRGVCTSKSDIWSFGVVLWETITLGSWPYKEYKNIFPLYKKLLEGYRMPKPSDCDDKMYSLMMDCWYEEPSRRPMFTEIRETLLHMLDENKRTYVNIDGEHNDAITLQSTASLIL